MTENLEPKVEKQVSKPKTTPRKQAADEKDTVTISAQVGPEMAEIFAAVQADMQLNRASVARMLWLIALSEHWTKLGGFELSEKQEHVRVYARDDIGCYLFLK